MIEPWSGKSNRASAILREQEGKQAGGLCNGGTKGKEMGKLEIMRRVRFIAQNALVGTDHPYFRGRTSKEAHQISESLMSDMALHRASSFSRLHSQ